jgi:hypothetical protein
MNISGRIPKGRERVIYTQGIYSAGTGNRKYKSRIIKSKRQRLEAKHSLQYFLIRQKTPPVIINTAGIMTTRPQGKR